MKNFSIKKVVLVIIAGLVGLSGIIGLSFSIVTCDFANVDLLKDTGYSLMGFTSSILPKDDLMIVVSGIICYIILALSILSLVFAVLSIFNDADKDMAKLKYSLICGNLATLVLLIIGIVDLIAYKNWYEVEMGYSMEQFLKTKAFIAFIITQVITVGYIICLKVIPEISKSETGATNGYAKLKEEQRISLLIKYKELLKEEIITEDEFNSKKREILLFDNEQKIEIKTQPKSAEEVKMQKIKEYKKMFDDGIISKEEFAELKKKLL